jgi:hypothetical protein
VNKACVLIAGSTKVLLLGFPLTAHFPVQDVSRDAQTHIGTAHYRLSVLLCKFWAGLHAIRKRRAWFPDRSMEVKPLTSQKYRRLFASSSHPLLPPTYFSRQRRAIQGGLESILVGLLSARCALGLCHLKHLC